MIAPAKPAPAAVTRWAVKCGKCAVEQHANGRCPDACPICGAVHPAWPKPAATPAPADGAPGERVSVSAAALDELDTATLSGCVDLFAQTAARRVIRSAAPLPAPSASAGVGAETISDEVHDAIAMLMTDCYRDGAAGVETAVAEHSRQRLIAAHLDALSTAAAPVRPDREAFAAAVDALLTKQLVAVSFNYTGTMREAFAARDDMLAARAHLLALVFGDSAPGERTAVADAPVRPDRAAVEALVKTIRLGIPLPGCMTGPSEPCGACRTCKAWSACAALLALVFGDSAPGERTAVADAPVRPDRAAVEDRETLIVETIDAELVALQRHAGDVANSSEGGASETDWANGVDYAARAIRQALDLATIRPVAPESEAQS